MSELFRHPFLLLVVGALLSGVVVPALTRHWQVHQKELEVKIDLVSDISESIMNFVIAIQVAHVGMDRYGQNPDQGDLTRAYREWQVRSAVIGSKLQAYFHDSIVPEEWAKLCEVLEDFYALEGMNKEAMQTFATRISDKLSRLLNDSNFGRDWEQLEQGILKKKSRIIAAILSTRGLNRARQPGAWPLIRKRHDPSHGFLLGR